MKIRIIVSAVLVILLSAGISNKADAYQWRGHRCGYYAPRGIVRVCPPRVIMPRVVVGGYYARPGYYAQSYYRPVYRYHRCYR